MNILLGSIWRVVVALWGIGNYWLRAAIVIFASWPVLIVLAAFIGWPALTATVALLPLVGLVIALMTIFDPLVLVALVPFGFGRIALAGFAGLIGLELAVGAYFAAVPVANDRGLIPLQLLLVVGIAFLAISGFRRMAVLLGIALAVIAAISFVGGREEAKTTLKALSASGRTSTGERVLAVGPRDEVSVSLAGQLTTFCTDKVLSVRNGDGGNYELHPPCKVFEKGGVVPTKTIGDLNGAGMFWFRAKNANEMARLTYTPVRK
ncbi:MAG: hypothetical protein HY433_00910 [Candidatus Liptonbacteria bacterium]|nr:hypothetical protein [Candidatus Liptonbacteria bacterium]